MGTLAAAPTELDQIALHQRLLETINRGDVIEAMALFADDAVFKGERGCDLHPAAVCLGKEEIRRDIEARVLSHTRLSNIDVRFFRTTWTTWTTALFEMRSDLVKAVGVERLLTATTVTVQGNKIASVRLTVNSEDEQTAKYLSAQPSGTGGYSALSLTSVIPYGRFIDVGGRRLYIECQGRGSPAVIFEAGLGSPLGGASSKRWNGRDPRATIQPDVARVTQTCTYDRAGIGRSDRDPRPSNGLTGVADLHTLLHNAGIQPPYVLVGPSFGGLLAYLYANRYPDEVAGIIFVDCGFDFLERQFALLPPEVAEQGQEAARRLNAELSRFESIDFFATCNQYRQTGPLPDVPIVVLTLGMQTNPYDFAPYWTMDLIAKREQLRQDMQRAVIHRVSDGVQFFADTSSHGEFWFIIPERVVAAVTTVVQAARGLRPLLAGPNRGR